MKRRQVLCRNIARGFLYFGYPLLALGLWALQKYNEYVFNWLNNDIDIKSLSGSLPSLFQTIIEIYIFIFAIYCYLKQHIFSMDENGKASKQSVEQRDVIVGSYFWTKAFLISMINAVVVILLYITFCLISDFKILIFLSALGVLYLGIATIISMMSFIMHMQNSRPIKAYFKNKKEQQENVLRDQQIIKEQLAKIRNDPTL